MFVGLSRRFAPSAINRPIDKNIPPIRRLGLDLTNPVRVEISDQRMGYNTLQGKVTNVILYLTS